MKEFTYLGDDGKPVQTKTLIEDGEDYSVKAFAPYSVPRKDEPDRVIWFSEEKDPKTGYKTSRFFQTVPVEIGGGLLECSLCHEPGRVTFSPKASDSKSIGDMRRDGWPTMGGTTLSPDEQQRLEAMLAKSKTAMEKRFEGRPGFSTRPRPIPGGAGAASGVNVLPVSRATPGPTMKPGSIPGVKLPDNTFLLLAREISELLAPYVERNPADLEALVQTVLSRYRD